MILLAVFVAGGLSLVQVLPTLELLKYSWHQKMAFAVVDRFYLPANQLGNFLLPDLHGDPLRGNFSARGNYWETCCYVGWVSGVLAMFGVVKAWRVGPTNVIPHSLAARFWSAVAVVGVLMALGGQDWHGQPAANGLYWIAYHVLPGFKSFHDPARCLVWTCFALSGLAAYGLDWALGRRARFALGLVVIAFLDLAWFDQGIYPLMPVNLLASAASPPRPFRSFLASDPDIADGQARYLAPDSARVWQRFTGHRSYRQGNPFYMSLWNDTLTPNLAMAYGIPDAYGYEPVDRLDTQVVTGSVDTAFEPGVTAAQQRHAAQWAGLLSVKYVATFREQAPEPRNPGLAPLISENTLPAPYWIRSRAIDRAFLSLDTRWRPRARLIADFVVVPSARDGLATMQRVFNGAVNVDLSTTAIIAGDPGIAPIDRRVVDSGAAALIVTNQPDRVVVAANATRPCLLILADSVAPGWSATVDGHSAPVLAADGCLRAVALPTAGANTVAFTYRPTSVLLGLYVSLLTLACLVGVGASRVLRRPALPSPEFALANGGETTFAD